MGNLEDALVHKDKALKMRSGKFVASRQILLGASLGCKVYGYLKASVLLLQSGALFPRLATYKDAAQKVEHGRSAIYRQHTRLSSDSCFTVASCIMTESEAKRPVLQTLPMRSSRRPAHQSKKQSLCLRKRMSDNCHVEDIIKDCLTAGTRKLNLSNQSQAGKRAGS